MAPELRERGTVTRRELESLGHEMMAEVGPDLAPAFFGEPLAEDELASVNSMLRDQAGPILAVGRVNGIPGPLFHRINDLRSQLHRPTTSRQEYRGGNLAQLRSLIHDIRKDPDRQMEWLVGSFHDGVHVGVQRYRSGVFGVPNFIKGSRDWSDTQAAVVRGSRWPDAITVLCSRSVQEDELFAALWGGQFTLKNSVDGKSTMEPASLFLSCLQTDQAKEIARFYNNVRAGQFVDYTSADRSAAVRELEQVDGSSFESVMQAYLAITRLYNIESSITAFEQFGAGPNDLERLASILKKVNLEIAANPAPDLLNLAQQIYDSCRDNPNTKILYELFRDIFAGTLISQAAVSRNTLG